MSDLGKFELTFEVSAGSDLEVVVIAIGIEAFDNLSVNGVDHTLPVVKVGMVEAVVRVVDLVGLAVVSNVSLGKAVVSSDGEHGISLEVFNFLGRNIVEVAEILFEVFSKHVD